MKQEKQEKESEEKLWRFSMELLQHVHILRLFLLPPSSSPLLCVGDGGLSSSSSSKITATLHSAPPLLTCNLPRKENPSPSPSPSPSLHPHHDDTHIRPVPSRFLRLHLPLPLLLFDYSIDPRVSLHRHAHGLDCIEISIPLLPLHSSLCHVFSSLSTAAQVSTTPRTQNHEATTDDSSQLHVRTEKPPALTTLSLQDGQLEPEMNGSKIHGTVNLVCRCCSTKILKNPTREFMQMPCAGWRDIVENWFGTCCCLFCSKAEALSVNFEKGFNMRPGRCLLGLSTCYVLFSDTVTESDSVIASTKDNIYQQSTLRFLDLGNGFMVSESEHSKLSMWTPIHCTGCQSLLGGYPSKTMAPDCSIMEGLHLFQFQISADDSFCDAFRHTTFEALFGKELQLRTDEGTSYRFLIRSLTSEMPLLQLVVLSYGSSLSTGCVTAQACETANDDDGLSVRRMNSSAESESTFDLQRVMKVMFSDCSTLSADERRSIELWVRQQDAEIIYMFDELATRLAKELHANHLFFPSACRFSEHFQESFLYI